MFPATATYLPFALLSLLFSSACADVPAVPGTARLTTYNATLQVSWANVESDSQGAFQDSLVRLLENGRQAAETNSLYGVLVNFTEGMARNQTASAVPFFALISCDANETMSVMDTRTVPNGTETNSTVATGGIDGNTTTNGTLPSATNSTLPSGSATNSTMDIFELAASLDATAAILYSLRGETCVLNEEYLSSNVSKPLNIYTSPSLETTRLLISQFSNIPANATAFNSTVLSDNLANLTGIISGDSTFTTPYLLANLTNLAESTNTSSPIVVTIGHAPTTTAAGNSATGTPGGNGGSMGGAGRVELAAVLGGVVAVAMWHALA